MKKLFVTTLICIMAGSLFAQAELSFGVKGGLNVANQSYEIEGFSLSPDSRIGFHGGVFMPIMFSDKFGIQPEILYSMKGSELDLGFLFGSTSAEYKLSYIDIPVLFRYQIIDLLSVHAGPQYSILSSAEVEVTDGSSSASEDIKDFVKGSDFGLAVGGQVDLDNGWAFGARYSFGLTNINDDADTPELEQKNQNIQIYAAFKFLK